jgi:PAS domain S-box-containing protein
MEAINSMIIDFLRRHWLPLFVVPVVGLGLSFAAFIAIENIDEDRVETLANIRINYRAADFLNKLTNSERPVQHLRAVVSANGGLTADQFHRLVGLVDTNTYPLRALEWAPWVANADRDTFEKTQRSNDGQQLTINESKDGERKPAATRDSYLPVIFEWAFDKQPLIIGYDMLSDPVRRAALLKARDEGVATATSSHSIVAAAVPVLDIYLPVYKTGAVPPTNEERRKALLGFAMGTYRIDALLNAAIHDTPPIVEDIYFYLGSEGEKPMPVATYQVPEQKFITLRRDATDIPKPFTHGETTLNGTVATERNTKGEILITRNFEVFGTQWSLLFDFDAAYVASLETSFQWIVLALGALMTFLLTAYIYRMRASNEDLAGEVEMRRRTERDLRRTESFLSLIVENMPNMIFVKDAKELRFAIINKAGEQLLGIPREELLRRSDYDFFPPEQASFFQARDREVLKTRKMEVIPEEPVTTRTQGVRLLQTKKIAVLDDDGEPQYLLGVSEDITERKQAEQQRLASEAKYRAIIDTAVDGIIVIDEHRIVQAFNPAAEKMFGYTAEEVVGRNIAMLMPEPYRSRHDTYVTNYITTGKAKIIGIGREVQGLRRNGEIFPVDLSVTEWYAEGVRYFTGILRDISDKKAVANQLIQSQKMEAIGQLTGGMAHDFNNILNIILGNLDILHETVKSEELDEAIDAALTGADLVHRLLGFARRQPLQPKVLFLNDLITDLLPLLRRTIGEAIQIRTKFTAAEPWPVLADPAQFENAVLNLAINARDAMPNGGTLTIVTANKTIDDEAALVYDVAMGDYSVVAVQDTGVGIPPEMISRVFEPFFTTKGPGHGTGLGLSMVFGYAKQSGGTVKIYSEVNRGTVVRLYLPRMTSADSKDIEMDSEKGREAESLPRGNERILLVEDAPKARIVAQRILASLGYTVVAAGDATEAMTIIDSADHEQFDLLFTDMVMPGAMSGLELARTVRQRCPSIKILLTSGFSAMTSQDISDIGAGFMVKPYRKADLAKTLRKMLDNKGSTSFDD